MSYQQQWHNNPPQNIMYNQEAIDIASQNKFMDKMGWYLTFGISIFALIVAIVLIINTVRGEVKRRIKDVQSNFDDEE